MKDLKALALQRNPLEAYIRATGREINTRGKEPTVCCYLHDDKNPSMRLNFEKGKWYCDPCGQGGNVIDLHMAITGMTFADAVKELAGEVDDLPVKPTKLKKTYSTERKVWDFPYCDVYGNEQYLVQRIEENGEKRYAQSHKVNGNRVNNLDGVARILYRMDKIHDKQQVFIAEGEPCVEALVAMGFDATCNSGGAGAWKAAYADSLKNKDVVILPDGDEAGEKWYKSVLESLQMKARSIQTLRMPAPYNDVGDAYDALGDDACSLIFDLQERSAPVVRGADVPIYSSQEVRDAYHDSLTTDHKIRLSLGDWLPTLGQKVRPLVPGEMVVVMADTGQGKSATLQNIAVASRGMPVLYFQLELPLTQMGERFLAITSKMPADLVERSVREGSAMDVKSWDHIYTCEMAGLTTEKIEEIINQAELKIGDRPAVVMIDYIGLVAGGSGKRYERMSTIAEELKVIAKKCNVIMFVASQIHRKGDGDGQDTVGLHDAKDSGSIENSSSLVLGCWRPTRDSMNVKILKNTKGFAGEMIECDYHGASLRITEKPHGNN